MIKILVGSVLFFEVLIFALMPYYWSHVATSKTIMKLFNGFSTGLFLGIAFLHMIPQANEKLQHLFSYSKWQIPLGSLISIITFLVIYTLEVYFSGEEHYHISEFQLKEINKTQQLLQEDKIRKSEQKISKQYMQTILTQFALSLHCFFECMSIGIEKDVKMVITLSIAITVHKWAEALTLGYSYYAAKMNLETAAKFALFHAVLNSSAVGIGWWLSSQNNLGGIMNGIAGGTFLYVCFVQKLKNMKEKSTILQQIGLVGIGLMFACFLG